MGGIEYHRSKDKIDFLSQISHGRYDADQVANQWAYLPAEARNNLMKLRQMIVGGAGAATEAVKCDPKLSRKRKHK
jgi:hypothetical protein